MGKTKKDKCPCMRQDSMPFSVIYVASGSTENAIQINNAIFNHGVIWGKPSINDNNLHTTNENIRVDADRPQLVAQCTGYNVGCMNKCSLR